MTTRSLPSKSEVQPLERLFALRVTLNWPVIIGIAIFALAVGLRFWDLGARALHHDESIHAQWSWDLLRGNYRHSPIFHGPLYYHVEALVMMLFGASDYTSRVSAAIFGSALVLTPLLLRHKLGTIGTLAAMAFLAFSPTLVYYSRFFREDIYLTLFTLLMVVAMWRYFEEGRNRWLVLLAGSFLAGILTKEGGFITTGVFLIYLDLWLASNLATQTLIDRENWANRDRTGEPAPEPNALERQAINYDQAARDSADRIVLNTPVRRAILTLALAPVAWGIAALWPFLGSVRKRMAWASDLPRAGDLLVLLGTITLPLLTPVARHYLLEPLGVVEVDRLGWNESFQTGVNTRDSLALIGLFAITTSIAAFAGLQWKPKLWGLVFLIGGFAYLTLMTSLWTNLHGLVSGPWGSLDYWITQQDEARGNQPWFYYYMVVVMYEFLPLALVLGGAWWMVVRGDAFTRLLSFWLFGITIALSYSSEKMPWNNSHITLPLCILAAAVVSRAFIAWQDGTPRKRKGLMLLSVAALGAGGLAMAAFIPLGSSLWTVRLLVLLATAGAVWFAAKPFGRQAAGAVAVSATIGAFSFFSLQTMVLATYERGDVPKDLLIYTQSSPDIAKLATQIDQIAAATGKGYNLPIAVDSDDSFSWPWAWYLRDYKSVGYVSFADGIPSGDYAVLLVNSSNNAKVRESLAANADTRYSAPAEYPHRWWFDERYKAGMRLNDVDGDCTALTGNCGPFRPATWAHIFDGLFTEGWGSTWAKYWRDHDPDEIFPRFTTRSCESCGSVNGFAYLPSNFDQATGMLSAKPIQPSEPYTDDAGRLTFGAFGSLPGQFFSAVDMESDADGNLYVIDSSTKRLQKFDASGNFIASVDVRGDNPADGSEPWGLGIAPNGNVIVADTFGWKVRVFDSDLKPTGLAFGQPPGQTTEPGDYDLFGPRDVIVDAQGNYWVTDTGHDRIMVYSSEGVFVRKIGSTGSGENQLDEPVGLSVTADGRSVLVADMYNSRVVILDIETGAQTGQFTVDGWGGQEVTDKPYIRGLRNGNVAVGLPGVGEVKIYTTGGELVGTIGGDPIDPVIRPYGLVETADGKIWVVESGSTRVRQFEIP